MVTPPGGDPRREVKCEGCRVATNGKWLTSIQIRRQLQSLQPFKVLDQGDTPPRAFAQRPPVFHGAIDFTEGAAFRAAWASALPLFYSFLRIILFVCVPRASGSSFQLEGAWLRGANSPWSPSRRRRDRRRSWRRRGAPFLAPNPSHRPCPPD